MPIVPSNLYYTAGPNVEIIEFQQENSWGGAGDRITTNSPPIMGSFFINAASDGIFNILTYNSSNFQYCELIYSCVKKALTGRTYFITQRVLTSYIVGANDGIEADISYVTSTYVSGVSVLAPINGQEIAGYSNGGGNMYPTSSGFETTVKTHLYASSVAKGIFYLI